jgi:hypothetical protein
MSTRKGRARERGVFADLRIPCRRFSEVQPDGSVMHFVRFSDGSVLICAEVSPGDWHFGPFYTASEAVLLRSPSSLQ